MYLILVSLAMAGALQPAGGGAAAIATDAGRLDGFAAPESIAYDPALDVYFVSNIRGGGAEKDNNGFISRVVPGTGASTTLIEGGRGGVTLHAPKGLALSGQRLWVADIDAVRAFDTRTGALLATVDLAPHGAVFLNGIAAAPDGTVYVSDTAIEFDATGAYRGDGTFRLFGIDPSGKVRVVAEGPSLAGPNGLVWDAGAGGLLVASFRGTSIYRLRDGQRTVVASGPGEFDGLAMTPDRAVIASSHADGGIHLFRDGVRTTLVTGLATPAGLAFDSKRSLILVPSFSTNDIRIWRLQLP